MAGMLENNLRAIPNTFRALFGIEDPSQNIPLSQKKVYEPGTREYEQDLKSRNGGLIPGRDDQQIESYRAQILEGGLTPEEAEILAARNPGSAGAFRAALQTRRFREGLGSFRKTTPTGEQVFDPVGAYEHAAQSGRFGEAAELRQLIPQAQERKIVRGPDGRDYYVDTQEPVLPDVPVPLKPPADTRTQDQKEYDLAREQGYRGSFVDYQKELRKSGATTVSVGAESFQERLGKVAADRLDKLYEDASSSFNELNAINEAEELLDKGIITGTAGDLRLGFGRALSTAGIGAGDEVARTDAYIAATAGLVASVIKQFGAGTGLSDADREYAAKMAGGKIDLTEESLRKILGIRRRASEYMVKRYNDYRGRAAKNYKELESFYPEITPAKRINPPKDIDPEIWKYMTPEERALFK